MAPEHKLLEPDTSVQYLKGVGPRMAAKLSSLEIKTLEDLIYYYPRDWEDRRQFSPLREARIGQEATFRGKIAGTDFSQSKKGLAVISALIQDQTGQLVCKWMRRMSFHYDVFEPFRKELIAGQTIIVHGKIGFDFLGGKAMAVDEHEVITGSTEDLIHIDRIVPIYPATEGISAKFLRKIVYDALQTTHIIDPVPRSVSDMQKLLPLQTALNNFHFPDSLDDKDKARERLAFQELFAVQTVLALIRKKRKVLRSEKYEIRRTLLTPFREKLGFDFTNSQKKVIKEIFNDMTSDYPMNRLLQGEVGSGKTVVALSAMLLACENKFQSVLMAPTEILAEQHYITMKNFLAPFSVKVGLLTGSVKSKERKEFLAECAEGNIDIAIGTHALLEKDVEFKRCGLIVIDEQHRFGVRHRLTLTQKKPVPDVLVMTATPIPRTLALGLYGDLDISVIEELPPGRQKITTVQDTESAAYNFVKDEAAKGRQAYIVYPLVDESDKIELKAAIQESEKLKSRIFKDFKVGLLHGQMPGKAKEKIMKEFHEGKFSILIATTVIEVGIDVPNATVMLIQHAERFGLSTLHQLRGRIGRGQHPSRCILVVQKPSAEAKQRIEIILKNDNGFKLAEADLEMRGPGEIFGTSQHGIPPFKIASFLRDAALISESQKIARQLVEKDPDLAQDENRPLQSHLRKNFSKTWQLGNIA